MMVNEMSLLGFVVASLIVLILPGPGVVYVVTRSILHGRRAGFVSVLGLSTGALVHVVAASAGLSALMLASATVFGVVKWLGALYLIYLGVRAILDRHETSEQQELPQTDERLFMDGVVVSVLNPKIAVFFLAFLPQFVDAGSGSVTAQLFFLGTLYVALAFCTDGAYALLASSARRLLDRKWFAGKGPDYATGTVFIGLGMSIGLTDRRT